MTNASLAINNGQVYTCVVTNSTGAVTSAPVALTVLRDTWLRPWTRFSMSGLTNVEIVFSKPIAAATATNAANYVFTNGLAMTGAALSGE